MAPSRSRRPDRHLAHGPDDVFTGERLEPHLATAWADRPHPLHLGVVAGLHVDHCRIEGRFLAPVLHGASMPESHPAWLVRIAPNKAPTPQR